MLGQGNERTGFRWFALIVAVLFVLFITITCLTIREKSTVHMETPTVRQMFSALIHNDQAMTVVITIVLINCSLYITSNLLLYFFKYDVSGESGHTVLGALVVPGFLIFAAFGMLTVLTTVFLANTVDYGEMKNHRRDESVIFSMQTFVVKLASGVAVLIAAICLSLCNLKQDTSAAVVARAADSSVLGLRLTMAGIPMIGLFIAVLVFRKKYILTEKKLQEINAAIKNQENC